MNVGEVLLEIQQLPEKFCFGVSRRFSGHMEITESDKWKAAGWSDQFCKIVGYAGIKKAG